MHNYFPTKGTILFVYFFGTSSKMTISICTWLCK